MADTIPKHIAIIMDGNGRWAKERGLPRTAGHREGIKRVKEIIKACGELGVEVVTFFAFSSENWNRSKNEIKMLMSFLGHFLKEEIKSLDKNNVRLRVIGRGDPIPKQLQNKLREAEAKTQENSGLTVVLALNYGSRQEIIDAAKSFAGDVVKGAVKIDSLDEKGFSHYLYTKGLPDPDLLIRTSGQLRVSNFLLWQLSYAEFYFPKKYWPDFSKVDLRDAIDEFTKREWRFGKVDVH
ncbi:MAG: isoprenyl transferase [Candidatus Omnitrophica bacterium]|nr:isoprenyl transferase [Candidatus Omnitrophota bacterium]